MPTRRETLDIGRWIGQYKTSALKRLELLGEVQTQLGSFTLGETTVTFASDAGCKSFNNDFVAVWTPSDAKDVLWAAAIADGVTGCLLASEASELAALCGLAAVASGSVAHRNPLAFVARVFRKIGKQVAANQEAFCPPGHSKVSWEFATRKGKFLQTTLNLVWATTDGLQIVAVGDGGIVYSTAENLTLLAIHQFGNGKLRCLGPMVASLEQEAYRIPRGGHLACFTDGLADAVDNLSGFSDLLFDSEHSSESILQGLNGNHPEFVDDNISVLRIIEGCR